MLFAAPVAALAGQVVTVFAAASLRGALDEVAEAYAGDVVISYGGSGQIARQVANGAPADIVILANAAWMKWLQTTASETVQKPLNLLGNRLVLVGPQGADPIAAPTPKVLTERLAGGRLALGQTQSVPAGIYARQWLETTGLWPDLSPHLAETENVRSALALVARGETPLGLVYMTDAMAEPGVVVLYDIPDDLHDPIIYPVAKTHSKTAPHTDEFFEFLGSDRASSIFRKHGFLPLGESG